jgi:ferric-dicitrate binding protein FerR (iron transport regulator)
MPNNNMESVDPEDQRIRVDIDQAWARLKGRLEKDGLIPEKETRTNHFFTPLLRMAAAILVLAVLGITYYIVRTSTGDPMRLTASTGISEEFGLLLPDGSTVDMNAHSRIRFSLDKAGNRRVKLSGEAFLNVSPDPATPFIINAGQAVIRVTGTAFSVRSEQDGNLIEVFVESGSVQLHQSGNEENSIKLESGHIGILENNDLRMENNNDENYLSWKTRKLIFRQENLGEVTRVLNRTYKKEFLFQNQELENCLFTGTFDQWPVDSVVRVIQLALNLDVEQKQNTFVLSGDPCN